jgi:hypothetical protein
VESWTTTRVTVVDWTLLILMTVTASVLDWLVLSVTTTFWATAALTTALSTVVAPPVTRIVPATEGVTDRVTVAALVGEAGVETTGAKGAAAGVIELEAAEAALVPTAFVAVTVKVYPVVLVNPVTLAVRGPKIQVAVSPPGLEVTVYPVIVLPPFEAGALQVTVAEASPAVAATPVGAPGTPAGVTALDAAEAGPVPTTVVAVTVKVYRVPLVSPVTVAVRAPVVQVAVKPPVLEVTV